MTRKLERILGWGIALLILCTSLTACEHTMPARSQSTYPNVAAVHVPTGWLEASNQHNPAMRLLEFVPPGQTVDRWTEMLSIVVIYHQSGANFANYLTGMRDRLKQGCAVPPVFGETRRFTDHGYAAATQSVACGQTTKFGMGEIMMQKVMMGENAIFDVQRAWRFCQRNNRRICHFQTLSAPMERTTWARCGCAIPPKRSPAARMHIRTSERFGGVPPESMKTERRVI